MRVCRHCGTAFVGVRPAAMRPKKKSSGCGTAIVVVLVLGLALVGTVVGLVYVGAKKLLDPQPDGEPEATRPEPSPKTKRRKKTSAKKRKPTSAPTGDDKAKATATAEDAPLGERTPAAIAGYELQKRERATLHKAQQGAKAHYRKNGATLTLEVGAFADSSAAHRYLVQRTAQIRGAGAPEIMVIRDDGGHPLGQAARFRSDPGWVTYRIGAKAGAIEGPTADVMTVFLALPN